MEFQAHNELKTGIFAYTEIFYDRKRWHSYNGEISQVAFEKKINENILKVEIFISQEACRRGSQS